MKYSKVLVLLLFFFVYSGGYSQDSLSIQIRMLKKDVRPSLTYYLDSQTYPIRVHYNQNSSYANDVKEYAEIAYSYICSQIGFQPPPEDDLRGGSNAYDIYIYFIDNQTNGRTIAEIPDDWEYEWAASYILLSPGIADNHLADIVAHEFTHACQFGYSYSDLEYDLINNSSPGKWFYENVASYYSAQVNPIDNKYTSLFGTTCGPLGFPHWGLDYSYNWYDGLLWPLFLSEWKDCTNIIPLIWERMGQNPGANILEDIDYVLVNSYNSSLSEALLKYAEWRYFTGDRDDAAHFENAEQYITSSVKHTYTSGYPLNNLNISGGMGIGGVYFIDCFSYNNEVFDFSVNIDPNYTQPIDFGIIEVKYDPDIDRLRKIELNSSNQGSIKGYIRGGENVVLLGLSLNSVSNLFHKFYYSISAPQERAVAFYTKWQDESSFGYLNGKLLIDGIAEVNSGDYFGLSYLPNYNNHNVKVASERLDDVNYIYKHNNWNGLPSQFSLSHLFNVASLGDYDKEGVYKKLKNAIIRNSIESLSFSNNVGLQFNDPWYLKNAQGEQSGMNHFLSITSPYHPTGAYNQTTGGVFLDQNPNFLPSLPYYSVQAISPQDIALTQTGKAHRFYFQNWSGTSVDFQNAGNLSTGVVFHYDNAVVNANYKGTQLSNQETGIKNPSQRKFVKTSDGTLHFVYESSNRIWYEISTDNGAAWQLMNNGLPLETVDSKLPCIDNYGNGVAIVYQKKNGNNYEIVLKTFNANGNIYSPDVTATISTESCELYSTDANPVIVWGYNGKAIIVWEKKVNNPFCSSIKGLKVKSLTIGYGTCTIYDTETIPSTDELSETPALVTINEDNTTNYFCLAWCQKSSMANSSEIRYNEITLTANNVISYRYQPYQIPSSGSGYTRNFKPSITNLIQSGVQNAKLSWIGERDGNSGREFSKVETETERKTLFKSKDGDSWYYYIWAFGNSPTGTSINSSSDGNYVVGWSESTGLINKYVRCTTLSQIKDFGVTGNDLQINNATGFGNFYGKTTSGTGVTSLNYFTHSQSVGSIGKETPNKIYSGREGVIYKDSLEFYFRIGDIESNEELIEFEDIEDGLNINSNTVLNQCLVSKPFTVNENTELYYSVQYGVKNPENALAIMGSNDSISFRLELIDGVTSEVIGLFDEVTYNSQELTHYNKMAYKVNLEGIEERTLRLRLVTYDNISGNYSVTTNYTDNNLISKTGYNEINYKGTLAVKDYAILQNYPNPFNPSTVIKYELPKANHVTLKVYDILGKEVAVLIDREQEQGRYEVSFDGSKLSSGVYICRITAGEFVKSIKMNLIK